MHLSLRHDHSDHNSGNVIPMPLPAADRLRCRARQCRTRRELLELVEELIIGLECLAQLGEPPDYAE